MSFDFILLSSNENYLDVQIILHVTVLALLSWFLTCTFHFNIVVKRVETFSKVCDF